MQDGLAGDIEALAGIGISLQISTLALFCLLRHGGECIPLPLIWRAMCGDHNPPVIVDISRYANPHRPPPRPVAQAASTSCEVLDVPPSPDYRPLSGALRSG